MIDELFDQDYDSFVKELNNVVPLYHCTTKDAVDGIKRIGANREFTGKNSNYYGQGLYTTFNLDSSIDNSGGYYGRYIIKFGLMNGFKDFLFFDDEMNQKYNNGEPIESQIERLCPPDVVEKLKRDGLFDAINTDYGTHYKTNKKLTASGAKKFFEILKGDRISSGLQSIHYLYDELEISSTKVRGYIFVGSNDGDVCVVRDFNSLIPLKYFDPTIGKSPLDPNDEGWIDVLNKDTYNRLSGTFDVGTDIRGEYPETQINSKTICGYILVKGKPAGKYNYLNVSTKKELLPVPADFAVDFDPHTEKAKFVIGGDEYEYSAKNNVFIEDGVFTYDRDEFIEELRDKGVLNENVNHVLSLINRINNL